MRPQQKPNRTRGRGNRKPNGNNLNRVYESTGPEGKVRGTPQQIIEKYLSLARDAQTSSNRVMAENFLQHAEHYQRILVEAMGVQPERQDNQQPGLNQYDGDDSGDYESDSDRDEAAAGSGRQRSDEPVQPERQPERPDNRRANGHEDGHGGRRGDRQNDNRVVREPEVSGLTMIDSGGTDTGNLLVDAEELGASQPRRRRRAPEQAKSPVASPAPVSETEPQPD
ncbi:MAG TPA: DUF4167 domain-containing protein [Thermohalobaculum sp.]|nr:DUF4167 domain-containing protein [Thermohalobaculum sp.]